MARTRSMAAPKLRRSGRKQEPAPVPATKMSKSIGITKKKAATKAKPAPKPKAVRAPVGSTASKTTNKASKRKASEIEDENEAPALKAKRAKATPAPALRKPTTHRYGTRSKRLSSPISLSPPAVLVSPPVRLSPSPEREPGEEQGDDRHSSPPLPSPPPPPPASSPPKPVSQLPLPAFDLSSLYPINPVPFKYLSGEPLTRLTVKTGGPLKRRELPEGRELQTLEDIREDGKMPRGGWRPVIAARIEAWYMWNYQPNAADVKVYDHDQDPGVIQTRLQNAEARAYQKRDVVEDDRMELRQEEKDDGYGEDFRRRNHPNHRLTVRTKHKRWSTVWKRKLFKFRQTELLKREKSGQKWEMFRVHDRSPIAEDCSAELEEEGERARRAREQFEAEKAAGLLEDADEYGDDYDPYAEDY